MMKKYLEFKHNRNILTESSTKIADKPNLVKLILSLFSTKEIEKMKDNIIRGRSALLDFNDNILKKLKKIISSKNNWGDENEKKFLKDFVKENEFNTNFSEFINRFASLI